MARPSICQARPCECMADDVPVKDHMAGWSEARLRDYFEAGGEDAEEEGLLL